MRLQNRCQFQACPKSCVKKLFNHQDLLFRPIIMRNIIQGVKEVRNQLKFLRNANFPLVILESHDPMVWKLSMRGPRNSPYEGRNFIVNVTFPLTYPNDPPEFKFETKIFHPNVYPSGLVCYNERIQNERYFFADVLLCAWRHVWIEPNANSPANPEAARLYMTDKESYNAVAKSWATSYGLPPI